MNGDESEKSAVTKSGGLKPGGSEGGDGLFLGGAGLILVGLGFYFLLDSVRVVTGGFGVFSGMIGRSRAGMETTSMGVIFVPFVIGVGVLFFDATKRWAWWLGGAGFLVITIEILSRIQFEMVMKTTHLLMILAMIAAGAGMLARAYKSGQTRD